MLKFKEIQRLNEAGLSLNGKAYPKFNNVIIAAGGAGSGKGFVLNNVLLFKGKTFDVDALKTNILRFGSKEESRIWQEFKKFAENENKKEKDIEKHIKTNLNDLDLKNPDDVGLLHNFSKVMGYDDKFKDLFFKVARETKNKPNVIFDVTLKDNKAIEEIKKYIDLGEYDKKNVHLVWILNSFDIAVVQNNQRDRRVSLKIMTKTHKGVALTMREILENSENYRDVIDGDIWIVPNQVKVDSSVIRNADNEIEWKGKKYTRNAETIKNPKTKTENMVIDRYSAICIKKSGKPAMKYEEIEDFLKEKIRAYVPKDVSDIF
jgi:hypothetical protein